MRLLFAAQTAARISESFTVGPGQNVSVASKGLSGSEAMTIQTSNGDGTFSDILETGSTMTATAPHTAIRAAGRYRVSKPVTANPASVAVAACVLN